MSELTFAKSFLSALDSRPIKLRADHVFDPERVGLRVPYTLPRLQAPHPEMPKKVKQVQAPGSSKSITVKVKSARNPALEFSIPNAPLATTTVQDLRDAVRGRIADTNNNPVPLDKIKVLYQRKPVSGTGKTIAEILADEPEMLAGGKEVEFSIMVIGGAKTIDVPTLESASQAQEVPASEPATISSNDKILSSEPFWNGLQVYLQQQLNDEAEAKRLRELFKTAWASKQ